MHRSLETGYLVLGACCTTNVGLGSTAPLVAVKAAEVPFSCAQMTRARHRVCRHNKEQMKGYELLQTFTLRILPFCGHKSWLSALQIQQSF